MKEQKRKRQNAKSKTNHSTHAAPRPGKCSKLILPFLLFVFCVLPFVSRAADVTIRLLADMKVSSAMVSVVNGSYRVLADGKELVQKEPQALYQLQLTGDSISIRAPGDTLGNFRKLQFIPLTADAGFKLKPIVPLSGTRMYFGELQISVSNGILFFRHTADLEQYVGGVVESESGGHKVKEFYKVQAILCRTYALNHLGRHGTEGFELCDGTHCQVYRSRPFDQLILQAVDDTRGLVLVDANLNLITAAFHSNCGGQTVNSEDVWAVPVSYLRAVNDTFCLRMPQAKWQRRISTDDWLSYLSMKHKYPTDSISCYNATHFQQFSRNVYFTDRSLRIPLKTLRSDWQLRSTFFSLELQNDSIAFRGRGWGHGVGLCQEGAIRMARLGHGYQQILNYYYRNVSLVSMSRLDFFREE